MQDLMEETQQVVAEKKDFEHRDVPKKDSTSRRFRSLRFITQSSKAQNHQILDGVLWGM